MADDPKPDQDTAVRPVDACPLDVKPVDAPPAEVPPAEPSPAAQAPEEAFDDGKGLMIGVLVGVGVLAGVFVFASDWLMPAKVPPAIETTNPAPAIPPAIPPATPPAMSNDRPPDADRVSPPPSALGKDDPPR